MLSESRVPTTVRWPHPLNMGSGEAKLFWNLDGFLGKQL